MVWHKWKNGRLGIVITNGYKYSISQLHDVSYSNIKDYLCTIYTNPIFILSGRFAQHVNDQTRTISGYKSIKSNLSTESRRKLALLMPMDMIFYEYATKVEFQNKI